ncbi:arsenic resistance N-acetyltransferase ArsN2 [Pseudomonas sp. CAU 1711]|uniref:arsenic resistance N-acetyltransferase ArsN2 n=1 Tax=Pseudomonas sp. CAU 1711 TaxID=3140356 RepID=UPI0032609D13
MRSTPFNSHIGALLQHNDLPTSDLEAGTEVLLFVAGSAQRPLGVVGLQVFGAAALLRSLAVAESERGKGLGSSLVRHAEQQAAALGVSALYLLTTTAQQYFAAHGYQVANRLEAPAAIAASSQFSGLCPSSSAFMVKELRA